MPSTGAIAARAGLVVVATLLTLGVLEVAVRLVSPSPPLMYAPDPDLGWVHPPNRTFTYDGTSGPIEVSFNSKGLRGTDYGHKKGSGVYRVLVLGDSYMEGVDVSEEDLFATRLGEHLRSSGCRIEVINAGVGGYGTDQEALFLEQQGWSYSPDLVLLAFTIDNDLSDNAGKGYCRMTDSGLDCSGPGQRGVRAELTVRLKAFLQEHSAMYYLVRERLSRLSGVRRILGRLGLTEVDDQAARLGGGMPLELFRQRDPDTGEEWDLTFAILDRMRSEATERDATFAMVIVPSPLQLDSSLMADAVRQAGMEGAAYDLRRPNRIINQFARSRSIPVIELDDTFALLEGVGEILRAGHWNSRGHEVAAADAYQALKRTIPRLAGC